MTYNRNTFRRILVCATAAALLCTGFAGCSDSNSSDSESGVNIAMEDLEYGATMRDDDSRAVPLEYDKGFLEDGELDALANYYASIQNEDVELFQSCTVEKYMESLYENAYGGLLDDNAYVTQQKESYEKQLSGDIHADSGERLPQTGRNRLQCGIPHRHAERAERGQQLLYRPHGKLQNADRTAGTHQRH